ncbi:MAG: CapA family protein [Bacilli bacterium]|nr:CapA family protein [Bacilli bacterium]
MKKRKVKKGKVALFISIFLIIIALCVVGVLYLIKSSDNSKKTVEEPKEEIKEEVKVEEPKEKRMSLVAVGDALIHAAVYYDASIGNGNYDFSPMFTEVAPLLQNYDLKYYNQETIIGGKDLGVSHYPRFNSPDEIALNLVDIGFNLVSLANNHTLDMNEQGVLNSVNFWRNQTEVVVSGQSDSFEDRNNIQIHEQNGIKYAFIAYTDMTNGLSVPSGKDYLVNVYSDEQAKIDIESVRDKVDVVIVSMHWGEEYTHEPTYRQKQEAQYLSSLGVDLIIGAHPHVIMPVDYVGDTLVIYSLGNFISGQSPLGLAKIIGLMVGMDIVVKDDKVTFENINYDLLYTYCTSNYKNYKVYPFDNLTDDILYNHEAIEQEYMSIVTSEVTYD